MRSLIYGVLNVSTISSIKTLAIVSPSCCDMGTAMILDNSSWHVCMYV